LEAVESGKWQDGPDCRFMEAGPFSGTNAGFTKIPSAQSGINFTNFLSERAVAINRVAENGSGVALGDVDGDGLCDIYVCGLERDNALYRNLGGWKFEDITAQAGVACEKQFSTGAVFADLDGDGDLDLLVNSIGGGTREFLNDGKGHFTEVKEGRLVKRFGSTSMALGDIDKDGDLDLYVANYRTMVQKDEVPRPQATARLVNGQVVVTPENRFAAIGRRAEGVEITELGERDFFYLNNGKGLFSPVSWTNGNFLWENGEPLATAPLDWGLSVLIRDLNGDMLPDIITCNDFFYSPDRFWFQKPGMRFKLPTLDEIPQVSLASMAVDVADINRDGLDDIFVAEMLSRDYPFRQTHRDNEMKAELNGLAKDAHFRPEIPRNTLFLNRGNGTYAEIAQFAGVEASEWSWGAIFLDVDLDGYEDLIIPTGNNHDVQNADVLREIAQTREADSIDLRMRNLAKFGKYETPVLAFRNQHDLRFSPTGTEWGFIDKGTANGAALADLDNDGDLDLVVNRLNGEVLLYRNDSDAPRIAVRLHGTAANTKAIGAKIWVRGGPVAQSQEMICGGRYLSCDDTMRAFAAKTNGAMRCEVIWPNGTQSTYTNLPANRIYEFSEKGNEPTWQKSPALAAFFTDASARLNHRHVDNPFDDYARQPLLPYSLSSQGPGIAWYDLDGDGFEDLVISSGRGGRARVLRNLGNGSFTNVISAMPGGVAAEDQLAILAGKFFGTATDVLVANGNYESSDAQAASVQVFENGTNIFQIEGTAETIGPLIAADYDGDGDLDLFVGGRVLPGRYPAACSSRLFRNDGGKFVLDKENTACLASIGMVTSAAFSDLDGDGHPDLILAIEWGSPRLFLNHSGSFIDETRKYRLDTHTGWWNSVVTGDFDNDGRIDFVMGNWGDNSKYAQAARVREKSLRIYYADFDGNRTTDLVEGFFNSRLNKYVPWLALDELGKALPFVPERFKSFADYSTAGVEEILGDSFSRARILEATELESAVFLNRGDHFEKHSLPSEAQFAPVFGMAVADLDNDGNEDLVLAQNLSDLPWRTGPQNSGVGLLLRGNGKGDFRAISPLYSGIAAYGQQRGLAVADYNNDGRVDLAIGQNNGETKLFENVQAPPGIRLRFIGGEKNRHDVGTKYRITEDGKPGPLREIQCGSGWLSQQSFVHVVKKPATSARISVQGPEGRKREYDLPSDAHFVEISENGAKKIN